MKEPDGQDRLVYRHRWPVRLWHWINALSVFVMLMSGFMIFNAHPRLYWGAFGANFDQPWLTITAGHLNIGALSIPTPGLLGVEINGRLRAFPPFLTIPNHYDLAGARQWHLAFAWLLVVPSILYLVWGFVRRHFQHDLGPSRDELRPSHIWYDIKQHAKLRLPTGQAAREYNILQKLAYLGVIFVALPGAILTGLTMSPALDAAWPWLLTIFGGRQSARSIHFLCASALAAFIVVHVVMVLLAGPYNELRSMITGWFRLPEDRRP
jgi:Ni/Fe-hydrogenase b-type cytochrome subunit